MLNIIGRTGDNMIINDKIDSKDNIKTIIFDIDGTITRWKNVELFLKKALNELNIPYRKESLMGLYQAMKMRELHALITSEATEEAYSMFLEEYIEDLNRYNVAGSKLKDVMFELEASETYVSKEVPEEIKLLKENYTLYCYTNWFRRQAIKKLDRYNITNYFQEIYSSEDNYIKYTKTGFEILLSKHNLSPETTVCIGDSKNDITPSTKAGINSIYLDYSIRKDSDITEEKMNLIRQATASITEFSDIRKVLSKRK